MKILMVCLGNICRSPLAEALLKSKLPDGFTVRSAGTISMHKGNSADSRMIDTAKDNGLDLSGHRAQPFKYEDFSQYDCIYCMDNQNLTDVLKLAKTQEDRDKVQLLLPDQAQVPDPYFGGQEGFDYVYTLLDRALDHIAASLIKQKN